MLSVRGKVSMNAAVANAVFHAAGERIGALRITPAAML
jgi:CO/xanthine dehydrogenase Mo-binding subunit